MSRHRREYALYKGEEFLDIGYARDLAEKYGLKEKTIHWKACCKRWLNRPHKGGYIVVPLEDEEDDTGE